MPEKKVLVAGASGLVGHAAIEEFVKAGWRVVGLSRRKPGDIPGAELIALDLLDREACERTLSGMSDVTHVVYAALQEQPGLFAGWLDESLMERNAAMLRNLFEPLSAVAKDLEHVTLLHGTKAYGLHHPAVGYAGVRIPLRERDPRKPHPNFYFLQEEYLLEQQRNANWTMTVYRPTFIYGTAPGNNMNPMLAIAVYASILREQGLPLLFPREGQTSGVHEAVDANLLGRAIVWGATSPAARNETFNVTNGDVFMWEHVWPAIAEEFGMRAEGARHMSFAEDLPKYDDDWARMVQKYGLDAPSSITEFVGYNSLVYTDLLFNPSQYPAPALNSTIKIRQAGFHECMDTEDMFRAQIRALRQKRAIPPIS